MKSVIRRLEKLETESAPNPADKLRIVVTRPGEPDRLIEVNLAPTNARRKSRRV